jgi:hypothetical protein
MLLISFQWFPALSSPFFNNTSDGYEPPFIPNPKGRGILNLVTNSLVTLTFAIWTVIHPNISPDITPLVNLRNQVFSILVALFTPELLLTQSYHEYSSARQLARDIGRITVKEQLEFVLQRGEVLLNQAIHRHVDGIGSTTRQRGYLRDAMESTLEAHWILDALTQNKTSAEEAQSGDQWIAGDGEGETLLEPHERLEHPGLKLIKQYKEIVEASNRKLAERIREFDLVHLRPGS